MAASLRLSRGLKVSKHSFKRLVLAVALTDGIEHDELVITNRAHVAWDIKRNRARWPTAEDGPMLWMTFLAYEQLRLDDALPKVKDFDGFQAVCLHVETIKDPAMPDEPATDDADPMTPGSDAG